MKRVLNLTLLLLVSCHCGWSRQFWHITSTTAPGITWVPRADQPHTDHVEMSGRRVSVVLRYGIDAAGRFTLNKRMVWPMLRTLPNNTHASLMRRYNWNPLDGATLNGRSLTERIDSISLHRGTLQVSSRLTGDVILRRTYLPSTERPALIELYEFSNAGQSPVRLELADISTHAVTEAAYGVSGSYHISLTTSGASAVTLRPGEQHIYAATVAADSTADIKPLSVTDCLAERDKRHAAVDGWAHNLVLETPDTVINTMFAFSKIRACESIYETQGGPMHGPGGETFYAAIWANDQAEYINPYFPFVGYTYGNASALNAFRHFARYMNEEWRPIPSSIIAQGLDYWNGAGDRGDAAMIAYGAARYALARADKAEAEQLWPLIEWCLEYCRRKLNGKGVVNSDSDELEGRFPAGTANLCTSSLYYDALLSAAYLADEMGKKKQARTYRSQAIKLKKAIDSYFAHSVEGYDTYAYYKGNDVLRAWICIPLTVGINRRAAGTLDALFSPRLWTENGLLTQAGTTTFWDRSTLYALRGAFMAGATERAANYLTHYSATRLLGEHVPYAVEAWPEGGQRHLSAESGLYGRIITEGLFGIRPTGFSSFTLTPRLPREWPQMSLRHIRAFGSDFDISVSRRSQKKLHVKLSAQGKTLLEKDIAEGSTLHCRL